MSRYSDDDEGFVSDFDDTSDDDRDVLKPALHHLGLSENYSPKWFRKDAFRELFQNWKDGIVATFGIDPLDIKPEIKSSAASIEIIVFHPFRRWPGGAGVPGDRELLGYIRFKKRSGTVEITNFKAQLERRHLDLGETSKALKKDQAGCHGEGFKLAALVMRRSGHSVRFETNSFYWNFGFRGTHPSLCCRLTQARPDIVQRKKDEFKRCESKRNFKRGLTANIWEDICVKIGKARGAEGVRVSEEQFRTWMTVSLELDPPATAEMIRTKTGDLILDARFQGRIYLRGLRVDGCGPEDTDYRFGYNFHEGEINRDRERLTDRHEEAQMLSAIWAEAIENGGNEITDRYIELFDEEEECPDISLATKYVSRQTSRAILGQLKRSNPGTFFYSDDDAEVSKAKDRDVIVNDFRKAAKKLKKNLWKILRRDPPLVRTPQEERNHLFETSPIVEPDNGLFPTTVVRTLKSSMMLHTKLRHIKIQFVEGGSTNIDLLFVQGGGLLKIHQKWLDFTFVHQYADCDISKVSGDSPGDPDFFCDHVVQDILELALSELSGPFEMTAHEKHYNAPDIGGTIDVRWTGNESKKFAERFGGCIHDTVTLHKSACLSTREEVLNDIDVEKTDQAFLCGWSPLLVGKCACPSATVSRAQSEARFSGLDHREAYFPLVSRAEKPSFFGYPPPSLAPKEPLVPAPQSRTQDSNNNRGVQNTAGSDGHSDDEIHATETAPAMPSEPDPARKRVAGSSSDLEGRVRDETLWKEWHDTQLPSIFPRLIPSRQEVPPAGPTIVLSLEYQPLNHIFESDEYACFRMVGEASEQVMFIHRILEQIDGQGSSRYCLSVTKYSFLHSTYPFTERHLLDDPATNDKEVVLCFRNFDAMGTRDDAEMIKLEDILSVRDLQTTEADGVAHVERPPQGDLLGALFCRFAICNSGNVEIACITPLASHLLPRRDRWSKPNFLIDAGVIGFDLTPNVLGPSEGVSNTGFHIKAAFGFDERKDATWKIRHTSQVFDGPLPKSFNDLDSGHLLPPEFSAAVPPKLVFLSGEHSCFRLTRENRQTSSLIDFLHPLEILDESLEALNPDFLVLLISPAVLHAEAVGRLSTSILGLLERRLSVHLRLKPLKDFAIPQDGCALTVIASPLCAPLPWDLDSLQTGPPEPVFIGGMIKDLTFKNARNGFVCSPPTSDGFAGATSMARHVYNHQTGRGSEPGKQRISVDNDAQISLFNGPKQWMHPSRGDRLTVRELARIQGFPDDFVFYGSVDSQYESVCKAIPPVVARKAGDTVLRAIRSASVARVHRVGVAPLPERGIKRSVKDPTPKPRAARTSFKRAKVEDEEDEDMYGPGA